MKAEQANQLIQTLKVRFEKNVPRHKGIEWSAVQVKLEGSKKKVQILFEMEETGGEPDVIGFDKSSNEFIFCDCSAESPAGRRSLCYDRQALDARKQNKPSGNVLELATSLGIEILTEEQYRHLQTLGEFDKKTSSWIQTPQNIRSLGGALFCDRRYNQVFTYHNGADSYYAARGFRGLLKV